MKPVIIYKSIFGGTKKIAEWLAERSGAKLVKFSDFNKDSINDCGTIIVMSGTYAGKMPLVPFISNHIKEIHGHKLVIISIGSLPEEEKSSKAAYLSIPKEIRESSSYFRVTGKLKDPETEKKLGEIIRSF